MLNSASFKSKPTKDKERRYLIGTVLKLSRNSSITLECSVRKKKMRSDSLKRPYLLKHKTFKFQVTTVVRGFLKDKNSEPSSNEKLRIGHCS